MNFSVVIPLYNKEKHISRAIISVLTQTHNGLELIVIDDGSTDNSLLEVGKFKDNRIKVISQKNSGVSVARNRGIEEANFEYIGFLDADDSWSPNFLEVINELIETYPEAGAYSTAYAFADSSSKMTVPKIFSNFEEEWQGIIEDYFKYSISNSLISASSVVIPKKIFDHIGMFPAGINRGEDLDMWCRVALNYNVVFSNKVCAIYYKNTENRASLKETNLSNSFLNYAEDFLLQGQTAKNHSKYFDEFMIKIIYKKALKYIELSNNKEARKLLCKYRKTSLNKKYLISLYILSFIPSSITKLIKRMKNIS